MYVADYASILQSYREINQNLKNVFGSINQVAADVESGSEQIANGSVALSQGCYRAGLHFGGVKRQHLCSFHKKSVPRHRRRAM